MSDDAFISPVLSSQGLQIRSGNPHVAVFLGQILQAGHKSAQIVPRVGTDVFVVVHVHALAELGEDALLYSVDEHGFSNPR